MASAAAPRKRNRNGRRLLFIIGGILVLLAVLAGAYTLLAPKPPVTGTLPDGWQTVAAEAGTISSTVSATGNVEPAAKADVRFEQSGTVTEIIVKAGDAVQPGQPLARIDSSGLRLSLEQSQADLRQAQADYEGLLAGADQADVTEARARLEQARNQYQQTTSSVSRADIDAARADLERAQAQLARLQGGPASDELATANEQVQRAEDSLAQARVDLSAAKERARLDVEARANALRNAQDEYSRIYWDNKNFADRLASNGQSLPQTNKDQEAQALRAVSDAEDAINTAQIAYEQSKQDEINSLQTREAELNSAIVNRDKVMGGAKAEDLASARAEVERAQAKITQLTGANRSSEVAASQSNIEIAQASLDKLLADPNNATLAAREAAVVRAEVAIKQAQRNIDLATLTAPFAATISRIDMQVGEPADGTAIIAVVDLTSFHVDVPVDELDIAQITPGLRTTISLDALPSVAYGGVVASIAPQATRSEQGTTTYEVTVNLDDDTTGVRPGMTAVVDIITSEKTDALLVPRRAVRTEGGKSYILIFDPAGAPVPAAGAPGTFEPANERREVTVGLSNSEMVEILSGLAAGEQVLVQDTVSTFNPAN